MKLTKIALGVALAAGTVAAQAADTLWFPHVVHSGVVTTILTVIDAGGTNYATAQPHHMHYIYKVGFAGETSAQINAKPCEESDGLYPFSKYDVQSFDVGGVLSSNNEGVLFNDPGVKNAWAGKQYARSRNALVATGGVGTRGYWVVEDAEAAAGALEGYATIFDYSTGSAWGYRAETFGSAAHTPVEFSAHLMPPRETVSRLLVTPYGTAADMIPASTGYSNTLTTGVVPVPLDGSLAIVDRDENIESGTQTANVMCVGTVDLLYLTSGASRTHVNDGGWMKVATVPGTGGTGTANAVVYQLDFGGQGATNSQMNGVSYPGTWNNLIVRQ